MPGLELGIKNRNLHTRRGRMGTNGCWGWGGLVTSTLLTLLVLPSIYRWFAEKPLEAEGG